MPNHVTNQIRVIGGTSKQRLAFIRAVTNKSGRIDFNSITRMPKSMMIDESSWVEMYASAIAGRHMSRFTFEPIKTPQEMVEMMRKHGSSPEQIKRVKQHALMRIENKRRYGFYSWYDWSTEKWGTKWNAYEVEMPVARKFERVKRGYQWRETHVRAYAKRVFKKQLARHAASGSELVIRFETAWNYPEPIYKEMASRFPHLVFEVKYADEDMGSNCGKILLSDGEFHELEIAPRWRDMSSEEKKKWLKFAFELRFPGDTPQQHGMNDSYEYIDG